MTKGEAINWIINLTADIGKVEHQDLWHYEQALDEIRDMIEALPPAEPERQWIPCSNPPKHHRDVIVRGTEAIGNVTVHKVMQWDVDTWRPTDYAPSIIWREWSEI